MYCAFHFTVGRVVHVPGIVTREIGGRGQDLETTADEVIHTQGKGGGHLDVAVGIGGRGRAVLDQEAADGGLPRGNDSRTDLAPEIKDGEVGLLLATERDLPPVKGRKDE